MRKSKVCVVVPMLLVAVMVTTEKLKVVGVPEMVAVPLVLALKVNPAGRAPVSASVAVGWASTRAPTSTSLRAPGRTSSSTALPVEAPEMIRLTRELANQGRLAEALVLADKLVLAEKMNPVAHYLRAMILLEQGVLPEAAKALQRAV